MPPEPELKEWMIDISMKVNAIHTALFGIKNSKEDGIVGDLRRLERNHTKLVSRVWYIVIFLAGSGAGTGIWQLLK